MSYTKNNRIICDTCGKFCIPYDEETPFGCSSYDPPEPLDPYHYCKSCSKDHDKYWDDEFKKYGKDVSGYWQKSNAEMKAAKKYGFVWLHSYGVGIYGTKDYADAYQYITQEEYDRLKNLKETK
jgi:hypothetical protein